MSSDPHNGQPRLLVVDDDSALLQMISWAFAERGYRVQIADSCHRARQLIASHSFDYALLDYHLPDGTGVDLLDWLRDEQPKVRALLMSGDPPDGSDSCVSCLVKPLSVARLHGAFAGAAADSPT